MINNNNNNIDDTKPSFQFNMDRDKNIGGIKKLIKNTILITIIRTYQSNDTLI